MPDERRMLTDARLVWAATLLATGFCGSLVSGAIHELGHAAMASAMGARIDTSALVSVFPRRWSDMQRVSLEICDLTRRHNPEAAERRCRSDLQFIGQS